MTKVAIYRLVDPRDGSVFYVGRSTDPEQRWRSHTAPGNSAPTGNYIRQMREEDYLPEIEIIDWVTKQEAPEKELDSIRAHFEEGYELLNLVGAPSTKPVPARLAIQKRTRDKLNALKVHLSTITGEPHTHDDAIVWLFEQSGIEPRISITNGVRNGHAEPA